MKTILFFLTPIIIALIVGISLYSWLSAYDNSGYVLIGFGSWSMETTVVVFAVAQVIIFLLFYMGFRALGALIRLPKKMKTRGQNIKFNRSQEALVSGLVDSAAGNWEQAEKVLIKHASNSGAPLLHYLTAARAAQSRGAIEKRDEYLQKAAEQTEGDDIAVGLTQAELHLSENQFDQAIETLSKLNSINPTHGSVLKLLHQSYRYAGDWEGLRKLIPSLHQNKVLMEMEVKLLETETYSRLLKQAAEKGDVNEVETLWKSIPKHIQKLQDVAIIYFAAMIETGSGAKIEEDLINVLTETWNETLLVVLGNIQSTNFVNLLLTTEKWLASHPDNSVLLRVLGKLSFKCDQVAKAEDYLTQSINLEPTVAGYQLLGDLFFAKNDKNKASECYKYGLELASSEVVSNVESISE